MRVRRVLSTLALLAWSPCSCALEHTALVAAGHMRQTPFEAPDPADQRTAKVSFSTDDIMSIRGLLQNLSHSKLRLPRLVNTSRVEQFIVASRLRAEITPHLVDDDVKANDLIQTKDPWLVNVLVLVIIAAVLSISAVGFVLKGRRWVPAVLASYALLIPGLCSIDFSFCVVFNIKLALEKAGLASVSSMFESVPQSAVIGPVTKSTLGSIQMLWTTKSHKGAILLAIFALAVPLVKLLLLGVGELWRHHSDSCRRKHARRCIQVVQAISKWATPDMAGFILLNHLTKQISSPPVVDSTNAFDTGFTCFMLFCICSVLSVCFVPLPGLPEGAEEKQSALVAHWCGSRSLFYGLAGMTVVWACLFVCGLCLPVMRFRLELDLAKMVKELGAPESSIPVIKQIFEKAGLNDMAKSQASYLSCIAGLAKSFFVGGAMCHQLNLLIAFAFLAVCMVGLTALDMALLTATAYRLHTSTSGLCEQKLDIHGGPWEKFAAVLTRHLASLDVCLVGVIVVTQMTAVYHSVGFELDIAFGFWILVVSEIVHYAVHFAVHWAKSV